MRDVSAPWLAGFGLVECPEPGYKARTRANVRDSDATLWFGDVYTPGGAATLDACRQMNKGGGIITPAGTLYDIRKIRQD
jgi:hypothetical protein